MFNLKEINEQIAKTDVFLQEAYAENNLEDIILFSGLMSKLVAKKAAFEAAANPEPVHAWMNAATEKAGIESAYEARILSRDEHATMDF